jgi:ATP-dependent Clp protease ATP-binding subunit ClpA
VASSGGKRTAYAWRGGRAIYPFERFTERSKVVLRLAQEEAERSHHSYIGTEHLLLGLLRETDGLAAKVLNNLGIEISQVRRTIESTLTSNERVVMQHLIPTSRVKKVIELSFREAEQMGHAYVGTEHVLLGLITEGDGIAAHVLVDLGATEDKVRAEIGRLLHSTDEVQAPRIERRAYRIGQRSLVHDPDPPYRLWEGRITGIEEARVTVRIPGRLGAEQVDATLDFIHAIPMMWTRDCPLCRAE